MTDKFSEGMKLFNQIQKGLNAEEVVSELKKISPKLAEVSISWIYGDIYAREGLDIKTRELLNVAALVVQGSLPQLKNHVASALNAGATHEEIEEAVLQMLIIVGFPAVVNAMFVVKEVFDGN